jgi:hypothetical protein
LQNKGNNQNRWQGKLAEKFGDWAVEGINGHGCEGIALVIEF